MIVAGYTNLGNSYINIIGSLTDEKEEMLKKATGVIRRSKAPNIIVSLTYCNEMELEVARTLIEIAPIAEKYGKTISITANNKIAETLKKAGVFNHIERRPIKKISKKLILTVPATKESIRVAMRVLKAFNPCYSCWDIEQARNEKRLDLLRSTLKTPSEMNHELESKGMKEALVIEATLASKNPDIVPNSEATVTAKKVIVPPVYAYAKESSLKMNVSANTDVSDVTKVATAFIGKSPVGAKYEQKQKQEIKTDLKNAFRTTVKAFEAQPFDSSKPATYDDSINIDVYKGYSEFVNGVGVGIDTYQPSAPIRNMSCSQYVIEKE